MRCKNCNNDFQGNYCSTCGQKSTVGRINFKSSIGDVLSGIFFLDRGFLFSLKQLTINPSSTIINYLNGKRQNISKPISYLFVCATIYLVTTLIFDYQTILGGFLSSVIEGINETAPQMTSLTTIIEWLATNYTYTSLILLPLFSFASYLMFRRSGYNYFEHLVINTYIKGQHILIYCIFGFVNSYLLISNTELYSPELIPVSVTILYSGWVYCSIMKRRKLPVRMIQSLGTYILNYVLIGFTLLALIIIETIFNSI